MSHDLVFYQHLADRLTQGPVAIATVIQTQGSVPREVGAKLLIGNNGQPFGTIGGGAGEAKVLKQAEQVLETGQKQQVTVDLSGASNREIQGICGGQMQVWVERWQGEGAIALTHQILNALNHGHSITLAIPLSQHSFPNVVSASAINSSASSHANAEERILDKSGSPTIQLTLQPPPTLLIVGGGHCGIQLAKASEFIGFQVLVQDERPEWANQHHFPNAVHIFNQPIAETTHELGNYGSLYVALVTRGMDYDVPALKLLLTDAIPCHYIGMMGSQKRIRAALEAIHFPISPEKRALLHAPIGLDIGALTPEEIAVSICAELIQVRRSVFRRFSTEH
ncbi:MAG: XdhC family protein [Okeania sp. SIO2G5]|nr:XdhC family protein [Okeania sp. SIO2G5]